jgi:quercetin dioxygenase-like cupin family protein
MPPYTPLSEIVPPRRNGQATEAQRAGRNMLGIRTQGAHMQLAPDQRLELEASREQVISVAAGVLYVALGDDEVVLTAGDSVTIAAGEPRRAWNAGDEPAEVDVSAEQALRLAA